MGSLAKILGLGCFILAALSWERELANFSLGTLAWGGNWAREAWGTTSWRVSGEPGGAADSFYHPDARNHCACGPLRLLEKALGVSYFNST